MEMENLKFKDKEQAKAFIERMEAQIKHEQEEKFHITDEEKADWTVKKILAIEDEIARLERQHQRRVKQLQREKQFFKIRFGAELEGRVSPVATLPLRQDARLGLISTVERNQSTCLTDELVSGNRRRPSR